MYLYLLLIIIKYEMIFPNDNKDVDLSCIESTCVCLPVQVYLSTMRGLVGALLCTCSDSNISYK